MTGPTSRRETLRAGALAAGAVAAALYAAGLGSWSVPAAGVAGPAVGVMIVRRAGAG